MSLLRIDPVQITAPRAREGGARPFSVTVLGRRELGRPRTIPTSGLWFALDEMTELHVVLVEDPFRPPLNDHFAVVVDDLGAVKRRAAAHHNRHNPPPPPRAPHRGGVG